LRLILDDFKEHKKAKEEFNKYYDRRGKDYYEKILSPLADVSKLKESDFVDWGHTAQFETAIGVGECAGVTIDLVATLLLESEEKLEAASATLKNESFADSIYHSYSAMINTAKSALIAEGIPTNSQAGIIRDFDEKFVESGKLTLNTTFLSLLDQRKQVEPSKVFAEYYLENAKMFFRKVSVKRKKELVDVK